MEVQGDNIQDKREVGKNKERLQRGERDHTINTPTGSSDEYLLFLSLKRVHVMQR